MYLRQLWEGNDSREWIREVTGKTKLVMLFLFSILTITVDNPRTLFIVFLISLLLHALTGTSAAKWQVMMVLLMLSLWGSMFSQALFFTQTPRTPLFVLIEPNTPVLGVITNGLYVYREGIIYGAVQGLRSAAMLSLGLLVCWNSDPRQLLQAMLTWHLPAQIAFMLVTAIRFLPVLAAETGDVLIALRLRSGSAAGRTAVIRHLPYIAKPLLVRCLRRSQTLALSVISRGFFLADNKKRAYLWSLRERLVCLLLFAFVSSAAVSKILYLLSEQGFYYGVFRFVYDLAKVYL